MKKCTAVFLALFVVFSMVGCNVSFDEEAAKELAQEKAEDIINDIFDSGKEESSQEPCALGCSYRIITENKNRAVRITCLICGNELMEKHIDFDTFKAYDIEGHTDEELKIMLAIYKARDIGIEMLEILKTLEGSEGVGVKKGLFKTTVNSDDEEVDSEIAEFLNGFKTHFDTCFAVLENDDYIQNCMSKDEFVEFWLGQERAEIIEGGEAAEDIFDKIRTVSSLYQLAGAISKHDDTQESTKQSTLLMLDTINHILGLAPDELLLSQVYSEQLDALKQSCEKYFKSYDDYTNLHLVYNEYLNDEAFQSVFHADRDYEIDVFIQVFSANREVSDCWSQPHMPTLAEMLERLSITDESGKTVYERLNPKVQLLVTKYVEYRVHYEFEQLTDISLEYYYDLMKPEKFLWFFDSWKAPWEKGIDPDNYESYLPGTQDDK